MAENLIFPMGFDLEAAVRKAESEGASAIRRLEKVFSRQPLVLRTDASGFDELGKSAELLKARLKEIKDQWDKMPTSVKFDLDSEGRVKQLTAEGKALWDELLRINTALQGVSMGIQQMARESQRQLEAENKAEQKRQQAIAASLRAEYKRIEAKRQAEAASRRELQMLNQQYAAEERRQRLASSDASIARRQQVIKTLRAEENTIANISAKLQHWQQVMNSSAMDGRQFKRAAEEVRRLSQKLSEAQARISQLTATTSNVSARQSAAVRQVNQEFRNQETHVSRLLKRMAVFASFSYASQFLTNVREVTAQFELQRVSLGAIIQDQNRANELFSEIKSFALKSPVSILDLTKYTKQLAAYKIGIDELFETTKKLTDVSVGLGVSMDRVVLAYGQTRATGYLRASEIRQFTEMGVPIVEELAAKLSKMNGELVTAAQVMDMVSKRGISFELVKEVFDDMTSAGGMFYQMQEKQGNTLFGLWAKLGDAASVMYDEIGNTESVNAGMRAAIQLLTELMRNWREVGRAIGAAGVGFAAIWATNKVKGWQGGIDAAKIAASKKVQNAQALLNAEIVKGTKETVVYNGIAHEQIRTEYLRALALRDAAAAELRAAQATTLWSKAWGKLKAALLGNWVTIVVAAIAAIGMAMYNAREKANRLKNTLKDIAEESGIEQMKSVRNFESLANIAVQAADGSKKQKDALDELLRTYKDIIPQERLTIENLREMKGNYDSLTQSIKDYVAQQMKQKQINAVLEITGREMIEKTQDIQDIMKGTWNYEQIARFMSAYERIIRNNPAILNAEAMKKAAEDAGIGWQNMLNLGAITRDKLAASLRGYATALKEQINQINALESAWNNNYIALGKYGNEYENLVNKIKENPIEMGGSYAISEDKTPYLFKQQQQNLEILKVIIPTLQKIMSDAGVVWQDGWANIVSTIDTAQPQIISSIDFKAINNYLQENLDLLTDEQRKAVEKLQALYGEIGITDEVVRYNRKLAIDLANGMEESLSKIGDGSKTALDNVTKYFMTSGQSVNDYAKTLDDALKDLKARIAELEAIGILMSPEARKELEDLKTAAEYVEKLRNLISAAVTPNAGSGRQSDPRLQNLKEEISLVQKLYNEYKQLEKQEGASKAAADMRKMAGGTLDMFKERYNIDLPTDAKDLTAALEILYTKMAQLPKKVFPALDKDLKELRWTIEKVNIDESQKKIESELKRLADRISRTKTAKEFYEKILSQTGDVELAANLSLSIYGEDGEDLDKAIRDNIQATIGKNKKGIDLDFSAAVRADGSVDYNALEKIAKGYLDMGDISEDTYNKILKMRDEDRKDLAKTVEGWLKATEKAKSYSDKLLDLRRKTQTEIDRINKEEARGRITPEVAESQRGGFLRKEAEEIAKLQYEAFKDSPMYVQMFDDLDNASGTMLRNMKKRIEELKTSWKDLTPTQLKEMQSRLNEIDAQLAKRNPFKGLIDGIKEYRKLRGKGDALGNKSEGAAEKTLDAAAKARLGAEKEYLEILNKEGVTQEEIAKAKKRFDDAAADEDAAAKALENWKKVKDAIGLSANELFQMLNWAGDIAKGIADISEAMGADEEDVQYWNDVADALNNISGGIQDIVSAAMSGNVVGIISSTLTAIPKMFVGFTNLFSAGKIKKANKEIKRQQELLDQLEYTYGRLENAADKLFGADYLQNHNQQIKNLEAQQQAYLKQAEAERSKGKKADKDKIKEYENQARDTADKIKELQDDLEAHYAGSSRTDVARQMAKSWVDARVSMSDTFAAIKSDYSDMIKNMIVEGAAARVIENALTPVWDNMEKMLAKNDINGAIDSLVNGMDAALTQANNGMEVLWKALEARGYDMKQLIGDVDSEYTGIAKNIAGASEESINTAAAIGNTIMYHTSHLPVISQNVAAMYQLMSQGKAALPDSGSTGWTDWQQQAMDNYNAIARNTADTVVECRRAAVACEAATEKLNRALRTKGATSGFNVFLNS